MSALRYFVILNLILTTSGFTADILGDYLGPYDYKGYIVFDYPEGQNPINNIVFNIDPTIADNLIIVSVPSPWSHAYGAGTLTLTGGSLSPGNLVQVTVSLNKYFEDGEYPISCARAAQDIGLAGSLLGARSSGKSIVGGIGGLREGKYVTGAGGLISGTASTILSASGATIGTGQMQISIPTSLPEVVTEVLKGVANLGSIVSRKAAEWIKMNNTYGARVRYFYQTLTATPFEIWECKGNQWVCIEKVYEITISKLLRGREIGARQEFKLESDIQRTKLDRHINRLMMLVKGQLESGIKARRKFEQDHQRGPCGS